MLVNINSSYFCRLIFSYLDIKRKFEIVKYNKKLKNILLLDLIDYKTISGKYIIFEKDGKGKEYELKYNELIFEGEYLNGKRNGTGKEFKKNKLIFEGEYLNGKRNGKGKEYSDFNGKLIFEGEYLNGRKWNGKMYSFYELKNGNGKVKEHDHTHGINFIGEYFNGERNGKGKELDIMKNIIFEGEYFNGRKWNGKLYSKFQIKNGRGFVREYYNNEIDKNSKLKFEGEYLNGERNGKGKEYDYQGNLEFDGEYLNNKRDGICKEYYFKKLKFEGEYFYGYKRKGKIYINGRLEYEGDLLFDKKWNGKGYDENGNIIYELKNGTGKVLEYNDWSGKLKFEGEYLNGKKNGKAKEYNFYGDLKFEAVYLNREKCNGKGNKFEEKQENGLLLKYEKGKLFSAGEYSNECLNGIGKILYTYGDKYEGEFEQDKPNGYGIYYFKNGGRYEGEFKDNNFEGYGIEYFSNGYRYEGEFKLMSKEGYGVYYFNEDRVYEGQFKDDKKEGYGIYYFPNGDRYEGQFKKGDFNGNGIFYSTLGFKYKGYFMECLSTRIFFIIYKILSFLNRLYSLIMESKIIILLLIIKLILGV